MRLFRLPVVVAVVLLIPAFVNGEFQRPAFDSFDGTWEGRLTSFSLTPLSRPPQVMDVRIIIKKMPASFYMRDSKTGKWQEVPDLLKLFQFQKRHETTLVGTFLRNGGDADGHWVEHQSIVMTRKDNNTILVYRLRIVNNEEMPPQDPDSKWANIHVGELRRVHLPNGDD